MIYETFQLRKSLESVCNYCFRPISSVGSLYKILSKRLWAILGEVIDERQSAFIGGRFMLDSVVITNEIVEEVFFFR